MIASDRLGRGASPFKRARNDRSDGNIAEVDGQMLHLDAADVGQRRAWRAARQCPADGGSVAVTNQQESRHGEGGGSQCAEKVSISRSVASKSPRKQTARSS